MLWKGVMSVTAPSTSIMWGTRVLLEATSHTGRSPATNTPLPLATPTRRCGDAYCTV